MPPAPAIPPTEQTLRENEERLRFALDISHTGTFDLDLVDHTAVRSLAHARIFGYGKLPPKWSFEMFLRHVLPEDRGPVEHEVRHAFANKSDLSFECRIRRVDGEVRWIWVAARHRCDAQGKPRHLVGIVQDVTELIQAQEALHAASHLNQQVISGAKEGIIVYGADLRYLAWNPFMEQLTGVPASRVLGRQPAAVFPFLKKVGLIQHLKRVLAGKDPGPLEFYFHVPKTNRSGWVSDIHSALRDTSGRISGVIGLVRDITERKQADERIAQLSRARAILTGVYRAIAHIPEQQKLLTEVCRLAVREGGFKLAWVGFVTPKGDVAPIAKAGATGYLKGIQILTRDQPKGRGPVGTAIRENRPIVIGDIEHNARMLPWLRRARRFGLNYVAAFPIRIGGQVAGAFQVYAPRPDFYDESEIALLTQVSDDLSFALTALSTQAARRQAEDELRRSERNLTNFCDQAPVGLSWLSANGTILRTNRAQLELLGCSPNEYLGHSFADFCVHPSQGRRLLQRLAAGETIHNLPLQARCKDGSVRHVLLSADTVRDHGRFQYSSIFVRDVTDRVRLEWELMQVGEREHQRIAQDLHDGLGQLLAGTAYLAGSVRQELAAKGLPQEQQLSHIQQAMSEALRTTRHLARGLHPVEPVPNGLMLALQALARQTSELFGVGCRLACHPPVHVQDNVVANHLFRIAQEAVTNSMKHAHAGNVEISLHRSGREILLNIKDDGRGLPRGAGRYSGAGLRIMRHRAGIIGGSVIFQNRPGGGTIVRCIVPLPNHSTKRRLPAATRASDWNVDPPLRLPAPEPSRAQSPPNP